MNVGDTLLIRWDSDGDDYVGVLQRKERGFLVLLDENGKQFVCRPDSLVSLKVIIAHSGSK